MKWKHLYNKLGLSSQITSASYSLKMAYKKHLFPFEEHQRITNGKGNDTTANADDGMSPVVKPRDQQSGDEDYGSVTSSKSSNVDQEADQSGRLSENHNDDSNTTQEVTEENNMDTTDNNINDRYCIFLELSVMCWCTCSVAVCQTIPYSGLFFAKF